MGFNSMDTPMACCHTKREGQRQRSPAGLLSGSCLRDPAVMEETGKYKGSREWFPGRS